MKQPAEMRGGYPVAAFDSLPGGERLVVKALRHWSEGPDGVARIAEMLGERMAPDAASVCHRALGDMLRVVAGHGRRKLVRHGAGCACVGADEAVLAHFVMLAATGDREDAMLVGSLMVEGPLLPRFTEAARQAGLLLYRADLAGAGPGPVAPTVH